MGFQERQGQPRGHVGPRGEGRHGGRRPARVVPEPPLAAGQVAVVPGAGLRGVCEGGGRGQAREMVMNWDASGRKGAISNVKTECSIFGTTSIG